MKTPRRKFLQGCAAGAAGALLPLPAAAEWGVIHELSGDVRLNGYRMRPGSAIRSGQTVRTGADGHISFTLAGDAYFLRPRSELRLSSSGAVASAIDLLRLVAGALGATFRHGGQRRVFAQTATIGIRGTGIYVETGPTQTYACTCFGSTEIYSADGGSMMEQVSVHAEHHLARRIFRDPVMGMRVIRAPFERHTNEEIARLEHLAGRPNPF